MIEFDFGTAHARHGAQCIVNSLEQTEGTVANFENVPVACKRSRADSLNW